MEGLNVKELDEAGVWNYLAYYTTTEPQILEVFSKVPNGKDIDFIARHLYKTSKMGTTFKMFSTLYHTEFSGNKQRETILRGNTMATKTTDSLLKEVCAPFLSKLLKEIILRTIHPDLDLEIDPMKLSQDMAPEDKTSLIEKRREELYKLATEYFQLIVSSDSIMDMPFEVKSLVKIISQEASQNSLDVAPIVGGLIMLRMFNPAILFPESNSNLGISREDIGTTGRRNLVLITKLLQNLSNGVEFGEKEEYMIPLNKFVTENQQENNAFLMSLIAQDSDFEIFKSKSQEQFDNFMKHCKILVEQEESIRFLEEMTVKYFDRLTAALGESHVLIQLIKKLPNKFRALAEMSFGFEETFAKLDIVRRQMEMIMEKQGKVVKHARSLNHDIDHVPHLLELHKIFDKASGYTQKAKDTAKKMKTTSDKVEKLKKRTEKIQASYKKKLEKK